MFTLNIWNKLSVRLSLLLLLVVLIEGAASVLLFNYNLDHTDISISSDALQVTRGSVVSHIELEESDAVALQSLVPDKLKSLVYDAARVALIYHFFHLTAIVLLTLVIAVFFSRKLLLEPIETILKGTRDITSGKLGVMIPVRTHNELGLLAEAFNSMSHSLQQQTEELVKKNDALQKSEHLLEAGVRERTKQLEALVTLSNTIAVTLELRPLLERIVMRLKGVVDYTEVSIFVRQDLHALKLLYYAGPADEHAFTRHWDIRDIPEALSVIEGRQSGMIPELTDDTEVSTHFRDFVASYLNGQSMPLDTWLGVPIIVRDQVVGLMSLEHDVANYYNTTRQDIAMAFASQVGVALENIRLYAEAQENAALEERRHLARELHDSVSQALFGITLGIDTAIKQAERDPSKLSEPLQYVKALAQGGLAEMRALIFELRPESLEQEGLKVALSKQAEAMQARHSISITLSAEDEPELPFRSKQALYRIVQEALHNIVKHARAHTVALELTSTAGEVSLSITDDGVGFDTQQEFPKNLGLTSMRERALALNGRFTLKSAPNEGTCIVVSVPRESANEGDKTVQDISDTKRVHYHQLSIHSSSSLPSPSTYQPNPPRLIAHHDIPTERKGT